MRNQALINEKIRQKALERKRNGTLKVPPAFKPGYDPRRKKFTDEERKIAGNLLRQKAEQNYQNLTFDELSQGGKRKRILSEQNGSCLHCGLTQWLGQDIKLELDHIDGNNKNNMRENLRMLCPNCHSFTETWRKKKRV